MITIIPAIDIINGQCVRLTEGRYDSAVVYHSNPLDVAKQFEQAGVRRLHVVDLDGARTGRVVNWRVLEDLCNRTRLQVDISGGLRTEAEWRLALSCGASYLTIGSLAVRQPDVFMQLLEQFDPERIILAADVKHEVVYTHGWQHKSNVALSDFLQQHIALGIAQVMVTDISKDGKLQGPATALYTKLLQQQAAPYLIASGGVASLADVQELQAAGVHAVIIGKAIYENHISLSELTPYLQA